MKIELDLSDLALAYLNDLAKEHQTTPSDIVSGLLAGFCLDNIVKDLKASQKPKKLILPKLDKARVEKLNKKRFAKRYANTFDYLSRYGFSDYKNNEEN